MQNYERYSKFINDWAKIRFPARPSEEERPIFDELMKQFSGRSLLILGATPEFRDLASKNKADITCVDLNEDMLEGMKQLMQFKNDKEKLIKANWLNMPFEDESFDAVFAEQSINVIETEKWNKFLDEVKRVLKHKGLFVMKSIVLFDQNEEEILKKAKLGERDIFYLYDKICNMKHFYKNNQRSHKEIGGYMASLLKQGKITEKQYKEFIEKWGCLCDADLKLHALPKEEYEALLAKYFKIKEILYGKDVERHSNHPIYVMEKQ
jgi:SAM-dependent methyltransferase